MYARNESDSFPRFPRVTVGRCNLFSRKMQSNEVWIESTTNPSVRFVPGGNISVQHQLDEKAASACPSSQLGSASCNSSLLAAYLWPCKINCREIWGELADGRASLGRKLASL